MLSERYETVIVGAGHAGAQAAIVLRQADPSTSIAVIGAEPELPYERPPLSKDYLSGDRPFERILIRPERFWADRAIAMLMGMRVVAIDPVGKTVRLTDDRTIGYRHLIWAGGGTARGLACAGAELRGVHTIRSRADVDRMTAELDRVGRIVVIGGGYIGLEAAAVLIGLGKSVTILEAQDRLLSRVAGRPLSRFFEAEHRARGVDVRLNVAVECILGDDGAASAVRLSDGTIIACDMVVVGIGIVPAVGPLIAAGALGDDGVRIDAHCRTSLADVFAIGDCAAHANVFADGAVIRLESVQNAVDQATVAAQTIAGAPRSYTAVPWFWSNQYDMKLQTVGWSAGHDAAIVRGDPATRSFSVIYLKRGRVIALDCLNAVRDYVQGRALVERRLAIPPNLLMDADVPLKTMSSQ